MGAKSNEIKSTQAETFLSHLKIRLSVGTSGTVTMEDHDIMVDNGKVQTVAFVTSRHETLFPTE